MQAAHADKILIITQTLQQGEALRTLLPVRQRDQVELLTLTEALISIQNNPQRYQVSLFLLDPQGSQDAALAFLKHINAQGQIDTILLGEAFDEEFFLTVHDYGVIDYLIKPINTAYFLARITHALQQKQLEAKLRQYNGILQQLGFIHQASGLPTARFFKHNLDSHFAAKTSPEAPPAPMALLLVQWDVSRYPQPLQGRIQSVLLQSLKASLRTKDLLGEWDHQCLALMLMDTSILGAKKVAERFYDRLAQHEKEFNLNHLPLWLGLSDTTQCATSDALLEKALSALAHTRQASPQVHP